MGRSVQLFATIALALLASVATLLALHVGPARGAANLPQGFTDSQVVSGLTNPTDMEFAPDGRLFVAEQAGKVRIAKPNGTLATFLDISAKVASNGERGLLALAFDPNFSTNHFVYLHYTVGSRILFCDTSAPEALWRHRLEARSAICGGASR
jgi:glucose/arabinose dehydrogenase